jgi:hypothetical protein
METLVVKRKPLATKKLKNPNDPPRKPHPDGNINYHVLTDAEIDARRNPADKYLIE